ncbi:MAG: hypothetical protein BYD32DRAFT_306774 [Podila humilis]|nr:MAG: hypothetical protein BYD32DRAFT_306774 [Podila humilis]
MRRARARCLVCVALSWIKVSKRLSPSIFVPYDTLAMKSLALIMLHIHFSPMIETMPHPSNRLGDCDHGACHYFVRAAVMETLGTVQTKAPVLVPR